MPLGENDEHNDTANEHEGKLCAEDKSDYKQNDE